MERLDLRKEYLTVALTVAELRAQEPRLRAAGFRKRRYGFGQSPNTGDFYQWWDKKPKTPKTYAQRNWQLKQREQGRCIICGEAATQSTRGLSQYCQRHLARQREYMKEYKKAHEDFSQHGIQNG